MTLKGNCLTTAMGIMPHTDPERAIDLALTLDIPFWPQLPRYSFYEDMYVQVSEHFPGIRIDEEKQRIQLNLAAFYDELPEYAERSSDKSLFTLSPMYSATLRAFLTRDLSIYPAVRGQCIGPLSFGLKITTEDLKPIIYNDEVRMFLFDFIARKVNAQVEQLRAVHPAVFVWVDEPGLEILFSSFTGYPSDRAKVDFAEFLAQVKGLKGVHLCGNPDWSFLLEGLDLDILSVDIFSNGYIFTRYTREIKKFLEAGGILCWGIVPTLTEELSAEDVLSLTARLEGFWMDLAGRSIPLELILDRAWLAPARCCLVNADGHETVERAFTVLREISGILREKYGLN